MLGLLTLCLVWLAGAPCDAATPMAMHPEAARTMDEAMTSMPEPSMMHKRFLDHHPCPPVYHGAPMYQQPQPIYAKAFAAPAYPKKEVAVHGMPNEIQYIHQPSVQMAVQRPMVTYVKPQTATLHFQTVQPAAKPAYLPPMVHQPKYVYQKPMYAYSPVHQKPMYAYAPVYQKPMYAYAPVYQKPAFEFASKVYAKKIEAPAITQVFYPKPAMMEQHATQPVAYAPKVVQVQPVQPVEQQMAQHPVYLTSGYAHGVQPMIHAPIVKPICA